MLRHVHATGQPGAGGNERRGTAMTVNDATHDRATWQVRRRPAVIAASQGSDTDPTTEGTTP